MTTVPLTLLTIASLWFAWQSAGPERAWWLAAAVVILLERGATFGYFIPSMIAMQGGVGIPDAQGKAALSQWLCLNTGRHALTLIAWLLALTRIGPAGLSARCNRHRSATTGDRTCH